MAEIKLPWTLRLAPPMRLAIVVVIAVAADMLTRGWLGTGTRLLLGWDVGALVYLFLAWMIVARSDDDMTRVRAQQYDQSGYVIFLLVTTAASASFVAIGFLAGNLKASGVLATGGLSDADRRGPAPVMAAHPDAVRVPLRPALLRASRRTARSISADSSFPTRASPTTSTSPTTPSSSA